MNKLFMKVATLSVGLAMAIGVGVAVGSNEKVSNVQAASAEWELITSAPSDWSGEYILTYEIKDGSTTMLDGSTFSSDSCSGANVAVSNNKITADDSDALTIAKSSTNGKYTVKVNGKYIGKNANSNGIDSNATWSTNLDNTISYSSGKVVIAGNGGRVLTWLPSNSNFKYYASSNNKSQLFKKVESKTLSSIAVTTDPTKTTYYVGDSFESAGMVVTATYSPSGTADVTSSCTFSPETFTSTGVQDVTISYTEGGVNKTTTQSVTVNAARTLTGIAVSTAPTKVIYTEGEYFEPSGLVITRSYSSGPSDTYTYENHTSEFTFNPTTSTALTTSITSVTISYGGQSTAQTITVNEVVGYDKITDLDTADEVFITTIRSGNNYILPAAQKTSGSPTAIAATISNNKLVNPDTSNLFKVSKTTNGYKFKSSQGNYYLNNDNAAQGVRVNSTEGEWVVTATTNGFKMTNNSRWLGVYSSDWRSYSSSSDNNYGGEGGSGESINFYGTTKEIVPLDSLELRNYPESDVEIGYNTTLSYYGLDSNGDEWVGDVTYTTSNSSAVTVDAATGEIHAVGAGSSNITVYAMAGESGAKVESEAVTITVLADPERVDLPVGNYSVNISASGKTKGDPIPDTSFEIKAKEGRKWYKNLTAAYTDMSVQYANEYSLEPSTGQIVFTNNSNAKITSISVDWYITGNYSESDIYVGSSVTPATHTTGTGGSGVVYIYALNTTESTVTISNPNTTYRSSFYSLTINFEVIDESEEFYSLVVSKSASWDKTTYKDGNAPSSEGLVATANYTRDEGQTISRSEDVTSLVSNWAFNPGTLHTGDTSFNVVATWDNHESASFTVTGITVTDIIGPITSGRYYIMTHDSACGMNAAAYTSSHPVAFDLSESNSLTAFDVTLVADNEYEITTTISDTKYYLVNNSVAASGSNDNIKITDSPISSLKSKTWSLEATEGGYYVKQNTVDTTYRYLSCYNSADWRGYINTNNGDPVIKFVAEGSYANQISEAIMSTETPLCNGGSTAPSVERWNAIAGITYIQHELSILTGTTAAPKDEHGDTPTGTTAEKAMARYDEIMVRYNTTSVTTYADFLGRIEAMNLPIRSSANMLTALTDGNGTTLIIIMASTISLAALGGYFLFKKKKQN